MLAPPPGSVASVSPSNCAEGPTERRVLPGGCKQRAKKAAFSLERLLETCEAAPPVCWRVARSLEFPSVLNVPDVPAAAPDHVAAGCDLATLDRPEEDL